MNYKKSETGYALIIVLFAIVFITVMTAVFMRGALSNVTQEKTVDENNLVVVAAESGVEYYTWEMRQMYDKDALQAEFDDLIEKAESPIDYLAIQEQIANDFKEKLKTRADELKTEEAKTLSNDGYSHKLLAADVNPIKKDAEGNIILSVKGTVEGYLPQSAKFQPKDKTLEFELNYLIPKAELAEAGIPVDPDDGTSSGGSLVTMPSLKEPVKAKSPKVPTDIVGIVKPAKACLSSSGNFSNLDCYITSKNEQNYTINKSNLFVADFMTSWGTIDIVGSFINIKNQIEAANLNIKDTEIVIGSTLKGNSSITLNNSKVKTKKFEHTADLNINNSDVIVDTSITSGKNSVQNSKIKARDFNGGTTTFNGVQLTIANLLEVQTANIKNCIISTNTYKANGQADFEKTDVTVTTNYNSGGASFKNSNLDVGGKVDTGGGLFYVEDSNVKISGDAHTANGSTIKNSVLNIGGYFMHTSKALDAVDSDIFVGGKVTATNGTNLIKVNMSVLGDYASSTAFKLVDKTNLSIAGNITLGNGGTLENSLLVASRINSNTTLTLKSSVTGSDYLKSDIMTMENSNVCVKDFDVRSLTMDSNSKIYYSNTFNISGEYNSKYNKNDVIKLPSDEFKEKCGVKTQNDTANPETPHESKVIPWSPPVLEKVTY